MRTYVLQTFLKKVKILFDVKKTFHFVTSIKYFKYVHKSISKFLTKIKTRKVKILLDVKEGDFELLVCVVLDHGLVAVQGDVHDLTHPAALVLLLTRVHPQVYRMHVRPVLRVQNEDALVSSVAHQHHLVVRIERNASRIDLDVIDLALDLPQDVVALVGDGVDNTAGDVGQHDDVEGFREVAHPPGLPGPHGRQCLGRARELLLRDVQLDDRERVAVRVHEHPAFLPVAHPVRGVLPVLEGGEAATRVQAEELDVLAAGARHAQPVLTLHNNRQHPNVVVVVARVLHHPVSQFLVHLRKIQVHTGKYR